MPGDSAAVNAAELALRLQYPAWCARFALEPVLMEFADTQWWRLFSLSPALFERVVQRVGLTLMFATDRRRRLLRGAELDLTRWALERSHFVPEPVAAAVRDHVGAPLAEQHAAASLHWCLAERPALRARLRLRFPRPHVNAGQYLIADERDPGLPVAVPAVQTHLGRLWRSAMQATHEDKAS
jgi:hypothetical protein